MARRFGPRRLEEGCNVAIQLDAFRYRHVKDILANNRDHAGPIAASDWTRPAHENVRGPGDYQ